MTSFEAGFNLPPGVSPGDPRAPWNDDFPPDVEDLMSAKVVFPEEDGDWKEGSEVHHKEFGFGIIREDCQDETYVVDFETVHCVVPVEALNEVATVDEWEDDPPDVEADEEGNPVQVGGGVNLILKNVHGRTATVPQRDVEVLK